jgi:hypothetical protein
VAATGAALSNPSYWVTSLAASALIVLVNEQMPPILELPEEAEFRKK